MSIGVCVCVCMYVYIIYIYIYIYIHGYIPSYYLCLYVLDKDLDWPWTVLYSGLGTIFEPAAKRSKMMTQAQYCNDLPKHDGIECPSYLNCKVS